MVREEVRGGALWLTIDREGKRNALSPEVMRALVDGLGRAPREPAVRAVVITGAGDRAFSAGGDLRSFAGAPDAPPPALIGELLRACQDCPRPVIARVNGRALGGGFGLMLACDLVVAADDVEVGTPEVNIGMWPHVITAAIHRAMPRKVALEMMLTGRLVSAREAERWGLINNVVPRVGLDAAVEELIDDLASKSTAVLELGKRSFYGSADRTFEEAIGFLQEMLARNLALEDLAEGVAAFLEKREPEWRGR